MKRFFQALFCLFLTLFLTNCSSDSSSKMYRIGMDPSWYPLDVMGKEKNLTGFTQELLQMMTEQSGMQFTLIEKNSQDLEEGLKKGEYEGMLSSLMPYVFYDNQYSFSHRFFHTGPVLVVPVNTMVYSLESLSHKEVGVIRGSTNAGLVASQSPQVIIRFYDSVPKALDDLVKGNLDAVVIESIVAMSYCNDIYQGKLKVATKPYTDQGLRLVTLFDKYPELIERFDKALKALLDNGSYDQLEAKWGFAN